MNDETDSFMSKWRGINCKTLSNLSRKSYSQGDTLSKISEGTALASDLLDYQSICGPIIPGVEIFRRKVFQQRFRGYFSEFARANEGVLSKMGMWPKQWATALMYAGTSKGFHIHPPAIPDGADPEAWFKHLFIENEFNYSIRPYDFEQWDCMFFISGVAEMFLIDERKGLSRRKMRFIIDGDDIPGPNNVGVVIPPGVSHAIRCASSKDLVMVYGTSTAFEPENEGRIAHGAETASLPPDWVGYWSEV